MRKPYLDEGHILVSFGNILYTTYLFNDLFPESSWSS